jgi:hypothetical protein
MLLQASQPDFSILQLKNLTRKNQVSKKRDADNIKLSGGILCLDFVNTVHCPGCADPGKYLNTYHDRVAWSRHVSTITDDEAKTLSRRASLEPRQKPKTPTTVLLTSGQPSIASLTIRLKGQVPTQRDLAVFHDYLGEAMMQSRVVKTQDGFFRDMTGNKEKGA